MNAHAEPIPGFELLIDRDFVEQRATRNEEDGWPFVAKRRKSVLKQRAQIRGLTGGKDTQRLARLQQIFRHINRISAETETRSDWDDDEKRQRTWHVGPAGQSGDFMQAAEAFDQGIGVWQDHDWNSPTQRESTGVSNHGVCNEWRAEQAGPECSIAGDWARQTHRSSVFDVFTQNEDAWIVVQSLAKRERK
jgi:hypothetical protein